MNIVLVKEQLMIKIFMNSILLVMAALGKILSLKLDGYA